MASVLSRVSAWVGGLPDSALLFLWTAQTWGVGWRVRGWGLLSPAHLLAPGRDKSGVGLLFELTLCGLLLFCLPKHVLPPGPPACRGRGRIYTCR